MENINPQFLYYLEKIHSEVAKCSKLFEQLDSCAKECLQKTLPYLQSFSKFSKNETDENLAKILIEYEQHKQSILLFNSIVQWGKTLHLQTNWFGELDFMPVMSTDMINNTLVEDPSRLRLPFRKRFRTVSLETPAKTKKAR